jgi:hypothetical protein
MNDAQANERAAWNGARFRAGERGGHYESWFQRANHPRRPLAFWIRYTIFRPADELAAAFGERWAVWFDGERRQVTAAKDVVPLAECRFAAHGLDVTIGDARLDDTGLEGRAYSELHEVAGRARSERHEFASRARSDRHEIEWALRYEGVEPPLLLLPRDLYARAIPRAKALVGLPNATFRGHLVVDGERVDIDGWRGSQNHNWGERHTDSYAWGQVAGFDGAPDVFLECSTAQIRFGPLWTPRMSLIVLRTGSEEIALNSLAQSLRARGRYEGFDWRIESRSAAAAVRFHIHAPAESFVGLTYSNPPGGSKTCLNTKLAACELTLEQQGRPTRTWKSAHCAAFEILTDRTDHGVEVVA